MPRANVEPLPGAELSLQVGSDDLASALRIAGSGDFPSVFSTSRLVALMECAAAKCLQPVLEQDELSVGVVVDIRHTAATPPGATVTAAARYLGRNKKLYRFEVIATDPGGEIGRGHHERAVVRTARLIDGATKRTMR